MNEVTLVEPKNKYQMAAYDPEVSLKMIKIAETLYQSGLYPSVKNAAGAFAIIQYGAEMGLAPMQSLQMINIVMGKPACDAKLLLALMRRDGWNYVIDQSDNMICRMRFKKNNQEHEITYTIEEAMEAGLTGKEIWKKYPADMLFSRCASRASRRLAPETTLGIYTIEEMESIDPSPPSNINPPKSENQSDPQSEQTPVQAKNAKNKTKKKEDTLLIDQYKAVDQKYGLLAQIEKLSGYQFKGFDDYITIINNYFHANELHFNEKLIARIDSNPDGYVKDFVNYIKGWVDEQHRKGNHQHSTSTQSGDGSEVIGELIDNF